MGTFRVRRTARGPSLAPWTSRLLSARLPMCTMGVLPCPGPRAIRIKRGPICPVSFWPKLYYRLTHQPLVYPTSEMPISLPSTCACLGASSLR